MTCLRCRRSCAAIVRTTMVAIYLLDAVILTQWYGEHLPRKANDRTSTVSTATSSLKVYWAAWDRRQRRPPPRAGPDHKRRSRGFLLPADPLLKHTMTDTCKTIREFRFWLEENIAFLENVLLHGPCHIRPDGQIADPMYTSLVVEEIVAEATRIACRFGGGEMVGTVAASPQAALAMLGRLLTWTQDVAPFVPPEMLTQEDLIRYLRLDVDDRDPVERVRNLIRYQGLPVTRRGRLLLFRKTAVDQWLDVPPRRSYARRRLGRGAPAKPNQEEVA